MIRNRIVETSYYYRISRIAPIKKLIELNLLIICLLCTAERTFSTAVMRKIAGCGTPEFSFICQDVHILSSMCRQFA